MTPIYPLCCDLVTFKGLGYFCELSLLEGNTSDTLWAWHLGAWSSLPTSQGYQTSEQCPAFPCPGWVSGEKKEAPQDKGERERDGAAPPTWGLRTRYAAEEPSGCIQETVTLQNTTSTWKKRSLFQFPEWSLWASRHTPLRSITQPIHCPQVNIGKLRVVHSLGNPWDAQASLLPPTFTLQHHIFPKAGKPRQQLKLKALETSSPREGITRPPCTTGVPFLLSYPQQQTLWLEGSLV